MSSCRPTVAAPQFIQAVLSYIRKKAEQSHNKIVEWIACCCVCCFWCLENCLRFINKNAYVQVPTFPPVSRPVSGSFLWSTLSIFAQYPAVKAKERVLLVFGR